VAIKPIAANNDKIVRFMSVSFSLINFGLLVGNC